MGSVKVSEFPWTTLERNSRLQWVDVSVNAKGNYGEKKYKLWKT